MMDRGVASVDTTTGSAVMPRTGVVADGIRAGTSFILDGGAIMAKDDAPISRDRGCRDLQVLAGVFILLIPILIAVPIPVLIVVI
jgi:hypothetical protein